MSETGRRTHNGGATYAATGGISEEVADLATQLRELADQLDQDRRLLVNAICKLLYEVKNRVAIMEHRELCCIVPELGARAGR